MTSSKKGKKKFKGQHGPQHGGPNMVTELSKCLVSIVLIGINFILMICARGRI